MVHNFIPLIAAGALPFSVAKKSKPRRYDETMRAFKKQ
jgi:hypothetical protein